MPSHVIFHQTASKSDVITGEFYFHSHFKQIKKHLILFYQTLGMSVCLLCCFLVFDHNLIFMKSILFHCTLLHIFIDRFWPCASYASRLTISSAVTSSSGSMTLCQNHTNERRQKKRKCWKMKKMTRLWYSAFFSRTLNLNNLV